MIRTVEFAYAGARMQARYGRLVAPAQWERMRRVPGINAFVQAARDTALRPWLVQLDPSADAHQIEAHLRAQFRRHVGETAAWAPAAWRPALAWVEVLPDLPAIAEHLRGGSRPWMQADPQLARLFSAAPRAPESLRSLQTALQAGRPLAGAWLEYWRGLWPRATGEERLGLDALVHLGESVLQEAGANAPGALEALQKPLRKLFRRSGRKPAGLFAYLALVWIEALALRGALLRRRLSLPLEGVAA